LYKTIGLNILFFFLIGCNQTNPIKEESGVDYSVEVLSAEHHGLALYNAMQSADASEAPTSREQDLLDMASQKYSATATIQQLELMTLKMVWSISIWS